MIVNKETRYLLKGEKVKRIIEKNDLHNWIRNTDNNLEIIKSDNIIPFYKILGVEQQRYIER